MSRTTKEIALRASLKHWQENEKKLREAKEVKCYGYANKKIILIPRGAIHYGDKFCSACHYHDRYRICPVLGNSSCDGICFNEWYNFQAAVAGEGSLAVLVDLAAKIVARIEAAMERSK